MTAPEESATGGFVAAHSQMDDSVNWVRRGDPGLIEARYVRRADDYVVVYLSSQTGCRQACRMCHLTATKQTQLRDTRPDEILEQADLVLGHYARETAPARSVHFNFMARGEPLANDAILSGADALLGALGARAVDLSLRPRFLVSSILPRGMGERALEDIFVLHHPEIYYSVYAMGEAFRRRWLPNALPAAEGLDRLASWQRHTYKIVKIHYAFIAGENDSEADVHAICDAIEQRNLYVHINIVRYNPPTSAHGAESAAPILARNAAIFASRLQHARVRTIARIGFDVAASCGMFVNLPHDA